MSLGTKFRGTGENIRWTMGFVREDLRHFARRRVRPPHLDLTSQEKKCVSDLRRQGFAVVQGHWSQEKASGMRNQLEAYLDEGRSRDFENGAYMRFRDDSWETDQDVRRIYHVERLVPELSEFRNDPFVSRVAHAYYGVPFYSGVLMFQHNLGNTDTRYYHLDWSGNQFKSFMYLDDVDENNGPFTYLSGTHRSHLIRLKKQIGNGSRWDGGFSERDLKSVLTREVKLCGPAGTLLLVDVRGFHRGSPQDDRSRSVLVNYIYPDPGDKYLEK